jgi:hypothetical protein
MGFVEETGAAQYYRDSRITPIYEGTNGIQAIDLVMRKLPMEGGAVVRAYLAEIAALDVPLAGGGTRFDAIRTGLAVGLEALTEATAWLLESDDTNDVLAGAPPYLTLFGTVAGAYYAARMALAAASLPEAADDPWLQAKVDTAEFYAEQLIPRVTGLASAVRAGAGAMFAIDPEVMGETR